jgi:hypothetical protein
MKHAIVMRSELFKHGRWDVGFHLLNKEYGHKAEHLREVLSADEAVAILTEEDTFPTPVLRVLEPLCRGSIPTRGNRAALLRAIREYPHLCLAIVLGKAQEAIREQQAKMQRRIDKLAAVSQRLASVENALQAWKREGLVPVKGPAPVQTPPENDAEDALPMADRDIPGLETIPEETQELLATHRFVAGVVYLDEDELIIPVHTTETMLVVDCWIVGVHDWKGPETLEELVAEGNVPLPRRYQDVGHPIGFLPELPRYEQNYGIGWR